MDQCRILLITFVILEQGVATYDLFCSFVLIKLNPNEIKKSEGVGGGGGGYSAEMQRKHYCRLLQFTAFCVIICGEETAKVITLSNSEEFLSYCFLPL